MEKTRKQTAAVLLTRLKQGPHLAMVGETLTKEQAEKKVRLWLESWIVPDVVALVPELREK